MEEQDLLLGLGEGRGTESPAGRRRGPEDLLWLLWPWWAGSRTAHPALLACFSEALRKGMQLTGKHRESWCSASVGDTLLCVVMRTRVQSTDLVPCARGSKGCLLP